MQLGTDQINLLTELEHQLHDLNKRKKLVDRNLKNLEQSIFRFEGTYLEETKFGNVVDGFEKYINNRSTLNSSGGMGGLSSSTRHTARTVPIEYKGRIFSHSSATFLKALDLSEEEIQRYEQMTRFAPPPAPPPPTTFAQLNPASSDALKPTFPLTSLPSSVLPRENSFAEEILLKVTSETSNPTPAMLNKQRHSRTSDDDEEEEVEDGQEMKKQRLMTLQQKTLSEDEDDEDDDEEEEDEEELDVVAGL